MSVLKNLNKNFFAGGVAGIVISVVLFKTNLVSGDKNQVTVYVNDLFANNGKYDPKNETLKTILGAVNVEDSENKKLIQIKDPIQNSDNPEYKKLQDYVNANNNSSNSYTSLIIFNNSAYTMNWKIMKVNDLYYIFVSSFEKHTGADKIKELIENNITGELDIIFKEKLIAMLVDDFEKNPTYENKEKVLVYKA